MHMRDGDRVLHSAHGEGTVLRAEPEFDEVPWQWGSGDWDRVVQVVFISHGCALHEWVHRDDLILLMDGE